MKNNLVDIKDIQDCDYSFITDSYCKLKEIRTFLESEFNVRQSTIGFDISLVVLDYYLIKKSPLTIKSLFVESKHSPTGIRYHLDDLLDDQWISKNKGGEDKRISILQPGKRLLDALSKF
jgi:predicted transcriptional regulator